MYLRAALAFLLVVAGCTQAERAAPVSSPSSPSPSPSSPGAIAFDAARVTEVVAYLAGQIGPREATTAAYRRAAGYVGARFRASGYTVREQRFHVPGGVSNYAAVQEGDTFNVVATPRGFEPAKPHVVIGAHLDTVPQAPGAVDNAAGVGIVLELARLASLAPPAVPIVFVAFAAEEARVPHGGLHGSRHYVSALAKRERDAIVGAISIDRVGAGTRVPICTAGSAASQAFARRFVDAARRLRIPASSCSNATSDHLSFERAGIAAVRIGPDTFAEYHTPQDVPSVFRPAQAERAGRILWAALGAVA